MLQQLDPVKFFTEAVKQELNSQEDIAVQNIVAGFVEVNLDTEEAGLRKMEVMMKGAKQNVLVLLKQLQVSGMITKKEYEHKVELIDKKQKEMQDRGQPTTFESLMIETGL